MRSSLSRHRIARRQAGAALVVGLLLLLVLTVLAISGMNSTSTNLLMAGNEQYSQLAFQAAESGIEQAIAKNKFNPDASVAPETRENVRLDAITRYTTVTTSQLMGMRQPAFDGSSTDKYNTYHFEIDSTGTSQRGATSNNLQAVAVIAPADATVFPTPSAPESPGGTESKVLE